MPDIWYVTTVKGSFDLQQPQVKNQCSKVTSNRLKQWLSGEGHWLLLQRTRVQFSADPNGNLLFQGLLLACIGAACTRCTYVHASKHQTI